MLKFKLFGGEEVEDLSTYLRDYYEKYPDVVVYIGSDSSNHGKVTKYATAISLLRPTKGVHVVYTKNVIKRERDLFNRLWKEVEYTREVADMVQNSLEDIYNKDGMIPILHLDLNSQKKYKSNIVHDAAIGYLTGLGYETHAKSDSWCATFCADTLVKN